VDIGVGAYCSNEKTFISGIYGDPSFRPLNFEIEYFSLVLRTCENGKVQVSKKFEYAPNPVYNGHQLVHLTYIHSPGMLISCSLAVFRLCSFSVKKGLAPEMWALMQRWTL
jgi:hypothetical protein